MSKQGHDLMADTDTQPVDTGEPVNESIGIESHETQPATLLKGPLYLTYGVNFVHSSPEIPFSYTDGVYFHVSEKVIYSAYHYMFTSSGMSAGRFNPDNIKSGLEKYIWNFLKEDRQEKQAQFKVFQNTLLHQDQKNSGTLPSGFDIQKITPYDVVQIFEIYDDEPLMVNSGEPGGELICSYNIDVANNSEDTFILTPIPLTPLTPLIPLIPLSEKQKNKSFFGPGSYFLKNPN